MNSLMLAAAGPDGKFDPSSHVKDAPEWHVDTPFGSWHPNLEYLTSTNDFFSFELPGFLVNFFNLDTPMFTLSAKTSITVFAIWISAAVLVFLVLRAARARAADPAGAPKGLSNAIEALVVFVRDEIVYPNCGPTSGRRLLPFFLTVFFFILTMNYIGMIPFSFTATNQLAVTFSLAAIAWVLMFAGGFIAHGPKFAVTIVPVKVEMNALLPIMAFVWIMLFILELVLGMIIKSFALMMRLKANMTAGHLVILSLLALPFSTESYGMGALGVALSLLIMLIEVLVCFLQAYVFTLLSAIFIGHSVNVDEHH